MIPAPRVIFTLFRFFKNFTFTITITRLIPNNMLTITIIIVSIVEIAERPPATIIVIIFIFAKKSYGDLIIEIMFEIFIRTNEEKKKRIPTKKTLKIKRSEKNICFKKDRSFRLILLRQALP